MLDELQEQGKLPKRDVATIEEAKANKANIPAWRNPGTDHSLMYHYGDVVTYKGKIVRSTHQGLNHWEPGTLGLDGRIWEIVKTDKPDESTEDSPADRTEPATPEWKPGQTVKPGERYTHQGSTYEVIQGHTTQAGWEPPAVPALWKKV
ncbi:carbohydrate-binding protein [Corynebacterium macclintockiae]|uniref:carbohydrate-binding protein n=1 Tax=Corynebacterium macclintockiae TaxID=2913501 RepID=UPI003EC03F90